MEEFGKYWYVFELAWSTFDMGIVFAMFASGLAYSAVRFAFDGSARVQLRRIFHR